jgi:hypothetical protein
VALRGSVAARRPVATDPELTLERRLDPLHEGRIVRCPGQRSNDRDGAPDLGSREEPLAANVEPDPGGAHGPFDRGELGVGPDEDGHLPVEGPGTGQRPDRRDHPGELVVVGGEACDGWFRSGRQAGEQPLRRSGRRAGGSFVEGGATRREHPVRQSEHLGRRSIIGLEGDHPGARIPFCERGEIVAAGAGERVDRLVLIAHHGQVLAIAQPGIEQRGLQRVRVLVLVYREPAVPVANLGRHCVMRLDQVDGLREHVLEVDQPGAPEGRFVAAVQVGHQLGGERRVARHGGDFAEVVVRRDPAGLGPFDLGGEIADLPVSVATRQAANERHQDRDLRLD